MKFYTLLLFICAGFQNSNGQINKEILGKWKVISVNTSDFFIDLETDSCFIYDKMKNHYPFTKDQNTIISEAKKLYTWQVEFGIDGVFYQYAKNQSRNEGKYNIDTTLSIMTVYKKDASENDKGEKIKITFKGGKLYQIFDIDGDQNILVLERQ